MMECKAIQTIFLCSVRSILLLDDEFANVGHTMLFVAELSTLLHRRYDCCPFPSPSIRTWCLQGCHLSVTLLVLRNTSAYFLTWNSMYMDANAVSVNVSIRFIFLSSKKT
jgi:hypothetical protein